MVNPKSTASGKRAAPKKAAPAKAVTTKNTSTKKAAAKVKAVVKAPTKKAAARAASPKAPGAKKPIPKKPERASKKPPAKGPAVKKKVVAPAKATAKSVSKPTKASKDKVPAPTAIAEEPEAKKAAPIIKVPPRKPGSVICPLSGWEVMPAKPGLSERTLNRLRARLLEDREQQLRQSEELAAEAEELAQERDPGDTQFDEESGEGDTINVERERDLLLSATARQVVDAIDRALARMDAGTYGLCLPAGRKLSLERLEAIPYAEECVDCKARAERRR